MRVLHVIASIAPASGGPSTAMWHMLQALRLNGVETELATLRSAGEHDYAEEAARRGIDHSSLHFFPRQSGFYSLSLPLLRWLRQHVERFDIVHAHGLFSFAPTAAAMVAKRRRVPFVIRPAGVLNRWGRSQRRPWLKTLSLYAVEKPLLASAARIHFTAPDERTQALDLGVAFEDALIPLPISLENAAGSEPHATTAPQQPNILFLSRIDPVKRLDLLIEAVAALARRHPTATLTIAGDGNPSLVASLRALATARGVSSRIRWLGFVSGAAKVDALRSCSLLVLPSHSENFGIAAVEAMHAAKPVVVSTGVGISWLIERTGAGLLFDGTQDQLTSALDNLLSHPTEWETMGQAGRRAVDRYLSLSAVGNQLAALYREILGESAKKNQSARYAVRESS